jgi:hypothetical protein
MRISELLLIAGGSIFGILGLLHAVYTFADTGNPRRLAPEDPTVLQSMCCTNVRLSSGGTTMWRAWLGFNFSHSLGTIYLWLAVRYWFRVPAIGIALGTLCFAAAWVAY